MSGESSYARNTIDLVLRGIEERLTTSRDIVYIDTQWQDVGKREIFMYARNSAKRMQVEFALETFTVNCGRSLLQPT